MADLIISSTTPTSASIDGTAIKVVGCDDDVVWAKFDTPTHHVTPTIPQSLPMVSAASLEFLPSAENQGITRSSCIMGMYFGRLSITAQISAERQLYHVDPNTMANTTWRFGVGVYANNTLVERLLRAIDYSYSASTLIGGSTIIPFVFKIGINDSFDSNKFHAYFEFSHNSAVQKRVETASEFSKIMDYSDGYPRLTLSGSSSDTRAFSSIGSAEMHVAYLNK